MDGVSITARLNRIGIRARAGRNTALMELAGELPGVVLSGLLGIHITPPHSGRRKPETPARGTRQSGAKRTPREPISQVNGKTLGK
jgi:hypothetical protein